ncbi:hypothetical protein BC940DRAFT_329837 [Gongronella butleri]|nr:hypothetical protein BC940DRAFT_329837 [Gongronella butleri]
MSQVQQYLQVPMGMDHVVQQRDTSPILFQSPSPSLQYAMAPSDGYPQFSYAAEQLAQPAYSSPSLSPVVHDLNFDQLFLTGSLDPCMSSPAVSAYNSSPESMMLATPQPAMHHQPLDASCAAAAAGKSPLVDPTLAFDACQGQLPPDQLMIHPLPTPIVPTQQCPPSSSRSVSPPLSAIDLQKEQETLYKLFDVKFRLEEAVQESTRRPAPNPTNKKKKQPNRRRIYQCQFCKYTSNRSNNKKQHEMTHFNPPVKPHPCLVCEKSFARKHDLKRHHQSHITRIRKMMDDIGLIQV